MKIYLSLTAVLCLFQVNALLAQLPSSGKSKGAYTIFRNAEKKFYKGNLKGGEATFERSAKRYENNGDVDGYIAAKAMEAIVLLNKDQPKEAFRAFRRAEELFEEQQQHNRATQAYLRLCLGKYHLYYKEDKEAIPFLKEARDITHENPEYVSPIFNIELEQTMGELYLRMGDKQKALDLFESAIEQTNKLPKEEQNQTLLAAYQDRAGQLYDQILKPSDAAIRYRALLTTADSSKRGVLNLKTGRSLYKYTEYETAYKHLKDALEYDLSPKEEAETKAMLATIAMSIKDYEDALKQNGEALSIQLGIGGAPRDIYDGLLQQGNICKELKVTGKTLYWYKKTVKNISNDWSLTGELNAYDLEPIEHLGDPTLSENFNVALLNYERAERLIRRLPSKERDVAKVEIYMAKGALYFSARNYEKSKLYYEDALNLMRTTYPEKHALVAETTRFMSEIAIHQKHYKEALVLINRSINAATKEGATVISNFDMPISEDAKYPYELLYSTITKATVLYKLSVQKKPIVQAEIERSLRLSDLAMEMLVRLRATYRTEGARYELSELSQLISHQAIQTTSVLYRQTNDQNYLYRLFLYIENSKSSLLLQAVQKLRAQKVSQVPDWVVEKENKLKTEIAYLSGEIYYEAKRGKDMDKERLQNLEEELKEAKRRYPDYLDYIEKTYPEYYDLKYKQRPISCLELQEQMGEKEMLLNYVVVDSFIHFVLVDKERLLYQQTTTPQQLKRSIAKYIRSLKGEQPDNFVKYSNIWYKALLQPIEKFLDNRSIIIIPDAELNYLPFELIPTALISQSFSTKRKNNYNIYKEVPYLLRKAAITYNYSATLYIEAKEHDYSNVPDGFMGFAPDFSKVKSFTLTNKHQQSKYQDLLLSPLDNAALEVKKIGELTNGAAYIGFDATEAVFKAEASKYGVLHFATHGILNHKYPLYSSLVLLGDDTEDGLLHTYELYNMQIKAELVALSACNTGVGAIQKGEGAMSVARGFAYAGCPNIAMTLWPVSDQATQILMENFYRYLMQGIPKAEALQRAKLGFLDAGKGLICTPYFWSGLILVGTPDKLHSLQILSTNWSWGIGGWLLVVVVAIGVGVWVRDKRN